MRRSAVRLLVALAIVPFARISADAASAPAQLRGKSIAVSWSENRIQRFVGEANFRSVAASHKFSIYVSSAGRVFSRLTNTTRLGTGSADEVGGRRTPVFAGQSLTVFIPSQGTGVRRLTIDFDSGFASCTAGVVRAKPAGAGMMTGTSLINGMRLEIQSVTVGGASCSTQNGNIFGGE